MASKKSGQQEMMQVDRSETGSPFWPRRTSQNGPSKAKSYDPSVVVGASYSHTDVLKLNSLWVISMRQFNKFLSIDLLIRSLGSGSSRPRTPPSGSQSRNSPTPPPSKQSAYKSATTLKKPYASLAPERNKNWLEPEDEEEGDQEAFYDYDQDDNEDEFGLPSIVAARRPIRKGNLGANKNTSSQSTPLDYRSNLGVNLSPGRARANSSDIAEERGAPTYPIPKKSEGKILRPQYKDILRDPANALHLISHPPLAAGASSKEKDAYDARISRINKFKRILQASSISLPDLRASAWSGLPGEVRSISWQLLLGYLPTSSERRITALERKRKEYLDGVKQAFEKSGGGVMQPSSNRMKGNFTTGRSRGLDENVWHQISIDVPRTSPHIELYSYEATQRSLERILYLWAIQHPASGYVQGINDLVTPFWQVFLGTYITDPDIESGMDPGQLPKAVLDAVEADSFWCLTKLLDGIQDNYIYAQPGIVRQVNALRDLTARIDSGLAKHLEQEGLEFMQFSFRWMNCLLMREVNVKCTIRMWDTYMAEEQGFSEFHLYVCAAFLVKWTEQLVKMDFQEVMMFLQALPTRSWTEKDVELLLSEAFIWQSLFRGSSAHLRNNSSTALPTT
ncbi:GTPase-activating protein [Agyrium rufum]|nr:GTPase-activating protein [Agyrium rufum]